MIRKKLPIMIALLVVCYPARAAHAQGTFGRLVLIVKDQDGNPVEGVTATATCKQLTDFIETKATNKKGRATLAFADGTKTYDIKLEYPGTAPIEAPFKPVIKKTITQAITLDLSGQGQAAQVVTDTAGPAPELSLRPAERTFNAGIELLEAGDLEGAREKFLQAVKGMPEMAAGYSALSGVHIELGDHASAIEAAQKLLELEPENPRGYRLLYEANRGTGDHAEAEKALAALSRLDKEGDSSRFVYNEGVEALRAGDSAAAKERFSKALELNPNLTAALSALARIHIRAGEFTAAGELAERLVALEPDNAKALMMAFDAHKAAGDVEKERTAFDRVLAAGTKEIAGPLYESGIDLFNAGKYDGAIRNFEQALQADPSLAKIHYHLGLCLVNQGDVEGAKGHFRKFIEMAPDDADAPVATEMLDALG